MALTPTQLGLQNAVWLWVRTDNPTDGGAGTLEDPYDASVQYETSKTIQGIALVVAPAFQLAVVTTTSAHLYNDADYVRITGATPAEFNGTFRIFAKDTNTFRVALPAAASGPSSVHGIAERIVAFRFDKVMKSFMPLGTRPSERILVNLAAGLYETRGHFAGSLDQQAQPESWRPTKGMRILGAGIDATVLKLVGADKLDRTYQAIGTDLGSTGTDGVEISDLTIDCALAQQPRYPIAAESNKIPDYAPVSCEAIFVIGSHTRIRRVRAINFGSQVRYVPGDVTKPGAECFVISISGAVGNLIPAPTDCVIEDCIIEKPGTNNFRETTCLINIGGEDASNGYAAFHLANVIRNCTINCDYRYSDERKAVPSKKFGLQSLSSFQSGSDWFVTLVTQNDAGNNPVTHNRVKGQNIRIEGVVTNPASRNFYNGMFRITNVTIPTIDSVELTYLIGPLPSPNILLGEPEGPGTVFSLNSAKGGTHFQAISVDGGIGAIAECNRVYGLNGGVYRDTGSSKSIWVRANHFYGVDTALAHNMGRSSGPGDGSQPRTPPPGSSLSAVGTIATFNNNAPHFLVAGQGVRVYADSPAGYSGVFIVRPNPTVNAFSYDIASPIGSPAVNPRFGALWQTDLILAVQNICELNSNTQVAQGYGPPTGFYVVPVFNELNGSLMNPQPVVHPSPPVPPAPFVFGSCILQRNILRIINGSEDPNVRATDLRYCKDLIVHKSIINLNSNSPIRFEDGSCDNTVDSFYLNRTSSGGTVGTAESNAP